MQQQSYFDFYLIIYLLIYRGCFENIVYNIASEDYPDRWPSALKEIHDCL